MTTSNQYSDSTDTLFRHAQAEALALKSTRLEPDHLWLALLHDKDSCGARLLRSLGKDETILYERLLARMSRGEQQVSEDEMMASVRCIAVINRAARLVNSPLGTIISSEFFFLALMYEIQSQGYQILFEAGIRREQVQNYLGLATFDLASLRLDTMGGPPVLDKQYIRRLDHIRLVYLPFLRLAVVSALFISFWLYTHSHADEIRQALQTIFHTAPFLLIQPHPEWFPWLTLCIGLIGYILWSLLMLPFNGFCVNWLLPRYKEKTPRRTARLMRHWFIGFVRTRAVQGCILLFSLEIVYMCFCLLPSLWWAASTISLGLFSLMRLSFWPFLGYSLSFKLMPVPEGPLTEYLATLCQRSGKHVNGLYVMASRISRGVKTTQAANAYLTPWRGQVRIVLTDTLYQNFPLAEQEVILAHEMGHLVYHDILRTVAWEIFLRGLFLYVCQLCFFASYPPATRLSSFIHNFSIQTCFLIALCVLLSCILLIPYLWQLIQQEYRADEYALQMTQNSEAFKSEMNRLAQNQLSPLTHLLLQQRLTHADAFARRQASRVTPPPQ